MYVHVHVHVHTYEASYSYIHVCIHFTSTSTHNLREITYIHVETNIVLHVVVVVDVAI